MCSVYPDPDRELLKKLVARVEELLSETRKLVVKSG